MELPPIEKTLLMKLIEARDPKQRDIRLIVRQAWVDADGVLERTAEIIQERCGVEISLHSVQAWTQKWGWEVRRVLHTPGIPDEEKAA